MRKKYGIFIYSLLFFLNIQLFSCKLYGQEEFKSIYGLISRKVSWLTDKVVFIKTPSIEGKDVFEIKQAGNRIEIKASSPSAAGMGLHYYLKNYCFRSDALTGTNLSKPSIILPVKDRVKVISPYAIRFGNYVSTYNYTMSFWGWKEWENYLDWCCLNGMNVVECVSGYEAVWQNTLKKLGYNDQQIVDFLPGPAYTCWNILNNLEGWGGPTSNSIIDKRAELGRKIISRMREMGIEPYMIGFYGMVPSSTVKVFPYAKTIRQGAYTGSVPRPPFLQPDTLFERFATTYYAELNKLFGKIKFIGADPFFEGGVTKGVDLRKTALLIQNTMKQYNPDAIWVAMSWEGAPKPEMLEVADKNHFLVLDLYGDGDNMWEKSKAYGGKNYIYSSLNNMGEKVGMYGKLDRLSTEINRSLTGPYGKYMSGIAVTPEGTENNPVLFDFVYDLGWTKQKPNIDAWIKNYCHYRYGIQSDTIEKAWGILIHDGPYRTYPEVHQGCTESIFCARPADTITSVSTWGTLTLHYDPAKLEEAARLLLLKANDLKDNEAFRYDLTNIVRQVVANRGRQTHSQMMHAFFSGKVDSFNISSKKFLKEILLQDKLLNTHEYFRLNRWLNQARNFSEQNIDKTICERNARMLITYWGDIDPNSDLREYSNREWAGLLKDFYYPRWDMYISSLQQRLKGKGFVKINTFAWDYIWTIQQGGYENPAEENWLPVINQIMSSSF